MKFTVTSNEIATLLQNVGRLLPSSNVSIPALTNYLFEVSPERISVTGGDQTMRITGGIAPLSCDGESRFLAAPSPLVDYIKSLPAQPLTIEIETKDDVRIMHISHQSGHIDIPVGDADLYISQEPVDVTTMQTSVSMNTTNLLNGVSATQQATHTDPLYTQLHGVRFVVKPDRLELCGTDTVQLIRYIDYDAHPIQAEGSMVQSTLEDPAFTLPPKVCSSLQSVLPGFTNEEVLIGYERERVTFQFGSYQVVSQIKLETYPEYNSVIPNDMPHTIEIDGKVLQRAAGRVNYLSSVVGVGADANLIKLSFTNQTMVLTGGFYAEGANTPGVDVEERIPVSYSDDMEGMQITFRSNSFLKFIKAFDMDSIRLYLSTPSQAVMITPVRMPDKTDIRGIFMPIRVN